MGLALKAALMLLGGYIFPGTLGKAIFSIIRIDNLQWNSLSFLNNYLDTNHLDEYLGPGLVLGWWLLHGVADRVVLSAALCGFPFLVAAQCFYTFLYQRFIMTCFHLY